MVSRYMDTMHESVVATGYFMHEGVPSNAPFLTPKAVLASAQAFADALQVAIASLPRPAQTDAYSRSPVVLAAVSTDDSAAVRVC